jgi:hypothetical protein
MADLYVLLANGRGDVKVTDAWDGNAPTELGTVDENGVWENDGGLETSEPYRNTFPSTTAVPAMAAGSAAILPSVTNGYPAHDATLSSPTIGSVKALLSDEQRGLAPRQHRKIVTWLVFTEDGGAPFHFRKSLVIGWSRFPRT